MITSSNVPSPMWLRKGEKVIPRKVANKNVEVLEEINNREDSVEPLQEEQE